jgi:4-amino-4-deoxychorismate lyase
LFETICVENGLPLHLQWHEERMNAARREAWHVNEPVILAGKIHVPGRFSGGTVRCRIIYDREIREIKFSRYDKRIVRSLKIVYCNDIDYHLKYTDRNLIERLYGLREGCDDILIVRNGLITDTSASNIIFNDGKAWFTPAKPLLKGTCRERLRSLGMISERDIRVGDIPDFKVCKLINAMRDPENETEITVSRIFG